MNDVDLKYHYKTKLTETQIWTLYERHDISCFQASKVMQLQQRNGAIGLARNLNIGVRQFMHETATRCQCQVKKYPLCESTTHLHSVC